MSTAGPAPTLRPAEPPYSLANIPGFRPKDSGEAGEPFGFADATEVWDDFKEMAEDYNKDTLETLSKHLDTLLIFAALFSSVNSGFLQFSFPLLSPDPSAQTNTLLLLIAQGVQNASLTANATTPAFQPSASAIRTNRLFTASLTTSLIASFGAVLGKQWLTHYAEPFHGSPLEVRRQIQRKVHGAEKYYLRPAIEVALPTALQVALFLFILGLASFLQILNPDVAVVNIDIAWVGLGILALTSLVALWDPSCPFQTPLTRSIIPTLLSWTIRLPIYIIAAPTAIGFSLLGAPTVCMVYALSLCFPRNDVASEVRQRISDGLSILPQLFRTFHSVVVSYVISQTVGIIFSPKEDPTTVDVRSVCWVFSNTNDPKILHTVAESIPTIRSKKTLDYFFKKDAIRRLYKLFWDSADKVHSDDRQVETKPLLEDVDVYGKALLHLFLFIRVDPAWWHADVEKVMEMTWPAIFTDHEKEIRDREHDTVGANLDDARSSSDTTGSKSDITASSNPGEAQLSSHPVLIAAAIKLLYVHRMHLTGSDEPQSIWNIDDGRQIEQYIYRAYQFGTCSQQLPLSLVAWALGILPRRLRGDHTDWEIYRWQREDLPGLWDAYTSDDHTLKKHPGEILANLLAGTRIYIESTSPHDVAQQYLPLLIRLAQFCNAVQNPIASMSPGAKVLEEARALVTAVTNQLKKAPMVPNDIPNINAMAAALADNIDFYVQPNAPATPTFLDRLRNLLPPALAQDVARPQQPYGPLPSGPPGGPMVGTAGV